MSTPSSDPASVTRPGHARGYRERLWPGPLGWAAAGGFAVLVTITLLPVRADVAYAVGAASLLVAVVVAIRTAAVVEVADGSLRAGSARIAVEHLGAGRVLDRAGVRAALGPGSDARAWACLRSWIGGAVEVEITDPHDPTPTWLVSSRDPRALLAAIAAAKERGPGADA